MELLEDIVEDEYEKVEVRGKEYFIPSESKMIELVNELFEEQLKANTAVTLGFEYEPKIRGVEGKPQQIGRLNHINLTKNALEQGVEIAQYMQDLADCEIAMHLLSDKPGLVTTIWPSYDQEVTPSSCRYRPYIKEEYPFNANYMGWCHSHVDMHTFHSPTDDRNVLLGLRQYRQYIPGTTIRYQPSLVLNTRGEYYGAMGIGWELDTHYNKVEEAQVNIFDIDTPTIPCDIEDFVKKHVRWNNGSERSYKRAQQNKTTRPSLPVVARST